MKRTLQKIGAAALLGQFAATATLAALALCGAPEVFAVGVSLGCGIFAAGWGLCK